MHVILLKWFYEPTHHIELQGWIHMVDVGNCKEKSEQCNLKEVFLHRLFLLPTICNSSVLEDIKLYSYR